MVKNPGAPKKKGDGTHKNQKPTTGRRPPPEGFITSGDAERILGNRMLYKYKKQNLIKPFVPPHYKYGFYKLEDVLRIKKDISKAFDNPETVEEDTKADTTFSRATPDDMEGVYNVAIELFPDGTTSANARKPLVAFCPDGNYIVRDKEQNEIVSYIHLQPLKPERMKAFLRGKIRGKDIRVQDIDPFATGKSVDVLVKSIGSTRKYGEEKSAHYTQRLLRGVGRELAVMGERGIIIRKIYATSETLSGIQMAMKARMRQIRTIDKSHGNFLGRYAYEINVATSDLPLLQPYKRALAEWQQSHPVTQD